MRVEFPVMPAKITLVDDVLTSGTQLMGALQALRRAGFKGEVEAFTAFCTLSFDQEPTQENIESRVKWFEGSDHARRTTRPSR